MKKALLIGINYENTSHELFGCVNDVFNMKEYLGKCGYEDSNVRMLVESTATKANILESINWLVKDNVKDSKLVFHYSGHGGYVRDDSGDEKDKRDEMIYPVDNTIITDDELRDALISPINTGATLISIFDSCHSGTVLDLKYTYNFSSSSTSTKYTILSDKKYKSTEGTVFLFSGCKDSQTSADSYEEGESQGAMTYVLLNSLKGLSEAVTLKKLFKGVLNLMKKKGYTQIPQLSTGSFMDLSFTFSFA